MKLTSYFIKHPVIALVLNVLLFVTGILCFNSLSIREYPEVSLPTITIRAMYPNASAELVETAVTNPLEDQLAGVQGVDTIISHTRDGMSFIILNFREGTSIDQSMMSVREAVTVARSQLPLEVRDPVVQRDTGSDSGGEFMIMGLESNTMDFGTLTHFASLNFKNAFRSVKGAASAEVWGQGFTFKIILDPKKLYSFGINVDEIYTVLREARLNLPVGRFRNEIPVTLNSELKTLRDYEQLVVRPAVFKDGQQKEPPVLLKQLGRVEETTDTDKFRIRINGKAGVGIAIKKTNDANPLQVSNDVRLLLADLQKQMPPGLKLKVVMDQADFIRASIKNIRSSIIEAILFVLVVIFIFLGNLRSTLVPLITIPVSMMGAFIFLKLFSFSINIITLMAMVLAVGLVVDDAIVVLENIERHIEKGETILNAAIKGAHEIGFAIVAMTLTLASVYAPLAFISGTIGQIFSEFAVALAGSVLLSGVTALTLSPLMCARVLQQTASEKEHWMGRFLHGLTEKYRRFLTTWMGYRKTQLGLFLALCASIVLLYRVIPHEVAPKEDRGMLGVYMPAMTGKNIDETEKEISKIDRLFSDMKEVSERFIFAGDWGGFIWMPLKPHAERSRSSSELVKDMEARLKKSLPSIEAYPWSSESGLPGVQQDTEGNLALSISSTDDYRTMLKYADRARSRLSDEPVFQDPHHNLRLDTMNYQIDLDHNALSRLGLKPSQIAKTIAVFFSGDQSLDFAKDGIVYNLTIKGEAYPWSLNELYVTNPYQKRISLGAVAKLEPRAGAEKLEHFNQMRSFMIRSNFSKVSLEEAMRKMERALQDVFPASYKQTWTGAAKLYQESSNQLFFLFALAVLFIFAILSMQFENFIDPFIILLTVPFACSGALLLTWLTGSSFNIYTQIGLITLIGLISKHGILIVEFANQLRTLHHLTPEEAVLQAAVLRLRPILMTTAAMVFGVIPLLLSHEAGHEARFAIGEVLVGGLSLGTVFTLLILPVFYVGVKRFER